MSDIVIVIIAIIVLLLILSFLLYYVIKRINLLSRNIFLNKIEEFDYLIGDKEQKIDELNTTISKKENAVLEMENKLSEYKSIPEPKVSARDVVLPKYIDFESTNLLVNYKKIKENFNFNTREMIELFLKCSNTVENDNKYYDMFVKVRSYFTYDVLYKLSTYQRDEQLIIVSELLTDKEKKYLNKYLVKGKFDIKKFINELDELIIKTNPEIKIFVGSMDENYNSIDSRINTIYDKNIIEGFKIIYKGIVYDYSI